MLQRIQTIYLLCAAGVSAGLIYVFELWISSNNIKVFADDVNYVFAAFLVSAFLSIVAIFRYKNRKSQFMLGRLNIILNFFLLGFFVYQSLNISGETAVSEKGIGMLLPIISIVFLALANKAIKKDEDLVKSVDRLR
jgi:magnesium-transporting ATPase (P-type)